MIFVLKNTLKRCHENFTFPNANFVIATTNSQSKLEDGKIYPWMIENAYFVLVILEMNFIICLDVVIFQQKDPLFWNPIFMRIPISQNIKSFCV